MGPKQCIPRGVDLDISQFFCYSSILGKKGEGVEGPAERRLLDTQYVRYALRLLGNHREFLDDMLANYGRRKELFILKKVMYMPLFLFLDGVKRAIKNEDLFILYDLFNEPAFRKAIVNLARSVGEHGVGRPQLFSTPLLAVWNFTNACNLRCKHCYQNAQHRLPDELDLHERLKIVDQLDANDVAFLAFSGGEPLMDADFWSVAEYAAKKNIYISLATNGTLISRDVAQRLRDAGVRYVEISLDSARPEFHDRLRGISGFWQRTVEGIKNCVEVKDLFVGLAPTITRRNLGELEDMFSLAKELGVDRFYVFNFIPTGRGKEMYRDDLSPYMREQMLQVLYRHLKSKEMEVLTTCPQFGRICLENAPRGLVVTGHYSISEGVTAASDARFVGGCGAGRAYCAIQPNGEVTPCVFMPITIGDLRSTEFMKIWRESTILRDLRDRKELLNNCGVCEYRDACGGCRARAYAYYDDIHAADPGCIRNLDKWQELTLRTPVTVVSDNQ